LTSEKNLSTANYDMKFGLVFSEIRHQAAILTGIIFCTPLEGGIKIFQRNVTEDGMNLQFK